MAVTLLRHAPLALEHQGRYNGWTDLSIDMKLFDVTQVSLLQSQTFDIIYTSDLQRCTQTLDAMELNYHTDARLREVRFKEEIEGLDFDEITKLPSYDEEHMKDHDAWHAYICAELQLTFEARIKDFLEDLNTTQEILICSHAGTIQKMLDILDYSTKTNIDYLDHIRIDNVI